MYRRTSVWNIWKLIRFTWWILPSYLPGGFTLCPTKFAPISDEFTQFTWRIRYVFVQVIIEMIKYYVGIIFVRNIEMLYCLKDYALCLRYPVLVVTVCEVFNISNFLFKHSNTVRPWRQIILWSHPKLDELRIHEELRLRQPDCSTQLGELNLTLPTHLDNIQLDRLGSSRV